MDQVNTIQLTIGRKVRKWKMKPDVHLCNWCKTISCPIVPRKYIKTVQQRKQNFVAKKAMADYSNLIMLLTSIGEKKSPGPLEVREAPFNKSPPLFGHCPNSNYTPPPHSNGHSGALFFRRYFPILKGCMLLETVTHWSHMPWGPNFVKIGCQWGQNF